MDTHQNKPLLYLDFLGFSEKIQSQSIEDSISYYKQILGDFEIFSSVTKYKVNFDVVSDSAFLWIDGDDLYTSTKQLFQIASSISHNSLFKKRPIRGAIIFDDFIIGDKKFEVHGKEITTHLILGKAIISGYRWEQTQDWFGISINPLYIKVFEEKLPKLIEELVKDHFITYYDIPTKVGEIKSYAVCGYIKSHITGTYILYWKGKTKRIKVPTYDKMHKELKDSVKDFSVLNKLTNTEKFYDYVVSKKLFRDNTKKPAANKSIEAIGP